MFIFAGSIFIIPINIISMRNITFIIITFFIGYSVAFAQYSETISSGRPGQAISPFAVGKYVFQTQTGVDFYNTDVKGSKGVNSYVPNSFFRYGVTERFEINSGLAYTFYKGTEELTGLSIGTRINLYNGEGKLPPMGLQVSFNLPTNTEVSSKVLPQALFIFGDSLTDKLGYTVNIGSSVDEKFSATGIYVLNFSYSLNDKVGLFVEPYGTFTEKDFVIKVDGGVSYLVNSNFQLDFLAGYGKNDDVSEFMVGAGFSWRFLLSER